VLELVGCGFSGGGLRMDDACLSIEYCRQIRTGLSGKEERGLLCVDM
jgi:hypothetical protein